MNETAKNRNESNNGTIEGGNTTARHKKGMSTDRNQVAFSGDVAVMESVDDYADEVYDKRKSGVNRGAKKMQTVD